MPPTQAPARQQSAARRAPIAPLPFTAAAHEHMEIIKVDAIGIPGGNVQQRGPHDVPAFGFLAHAVLEVDLSGGVLGAGVLHPDFPFNVLQGISLEDVNGAPIFGPLDGFATYVANLFGGYGYRQDIKLLEGYDGTINAKFILRIPIQISRHNAYGALANQNSAAAYKLRYTVNLATGPTGMFTTAPTTVPSVSVRSSIEAWSQPDATDLAGRPQFREPPGHGTTQFWSSTLRDVPAGQINLPLPRVGNVIRNLAFIVRNAAGARQNNVFPDPFTLSWDARNKTSETQFYRRARQSESLQAPGSVPTGVFALPFNDLVLGHAGDEEPNLWLPTVQSTRLELTGVIGAAGTIQVLTNDVAPVEVNPAERYVENSATGFTPQVGAPVAQ